MASAGRQEPEQQEQRQQAQTQQLTLPQRFFNFFQHEITQLQGQIDRLADLPTIGGERSDAAEHCLAAISRLSTEVKEASSYLPPYDQRTYSAAIKALQEKLQETKAAFAPKPKFSFKAARKSPSAISLSDAAVLAAQKRQAALLGAHDPHHLQQQQQQQQQNAAISTPSSGLASTPEGGDETDVTPRSSAPAAAATTRPKLSTSSTSITISNQTRSHIILPATSISPSPPCTLSHLTSCVVNLLPATTTTTATATRPSLSSTAAAFPSLSLTNTTSSLLLLGHIAGPTHMTSLTKTTILLSTHQLRIHNSSNLHVYLHSTSRPIIENSTAIVFSPLPEPYVSLLRPLLGGVDVDTTPTTTTTTTAGGLDPSQLWHQVDDFQWIKATPSPNWSIDLSRDLDRRADIWPRILDAGGGTGGGSWSVDDTLAAVGIPQ